MFRITNELRLLPLMLRPKQNEVRSIVHAIDRSENKCENLMSELIAENEQIVVEISIKECSKSSKLVMLKTKHEN